MASKGEQLKLDSIPDLSSGNISFTKNLYSLLRKEKEGNILFSPFSLEMALLLTYIGSEGNTEQEIRKLFILPDDKADTLKAVKHVVEALENDGENRVLISVANGFFVEKDYATTIKMDFVSNAIKYFSALVEKLDFKEAEKSVEVVNKFVESKTNNKITNALNKDAFKLLARAFIVNTVYFKGTWEREFNLLFTHEDDFYINKKETVKVPFMSCFEYFQHGKSRDFDMLKLPYKTMFRKETECHMIFVIPNQINGLQEVEKQLENLDLIELIEACSLRWVDLHLPKFKLNEEISNLKNMLNHLEVSDLFQLEKANLKGISDELGLHIDDIVQKSFLEVTEKGTEAAAMTRLLLRGGGCPPDIVKLNVNRPFLFFIYSCTTKMILFFGRIKKF